MIFLILNWYLMKNNEYREIVMTHLQYIKEKVDANYAHLEKLNGRVTKNEKIISWIVGVGGGVSFVLSCILGWITFK